MARPIIEFQAKIYLNDLINCSRYFGFKADEVWEIILVSDAEKSAIEKKYFPTISAKGLPETLSEVYHMVKSKLIQTKYDLNKKAHSIHVSGTNPKYLVAFNPYRQR
jgi:hypothetical protein